MKDYRNITAEAFLKSYDRDILDLQDDPASYINELEDALATACPMGFSFDKQGNRVWPVGLLKQITGVNTEEPLWEISKHAAL